VIYYHYYENGEHSVSPHFGIKTKHYKLIRFYTRVNNWELYDLQSEKNEMNNLYGKKGFESIYQNIEIRTKSTNKFDDSDARQILISGNW